MGRESPANSSETDPRSGPESTAIWGTSAAEPEPVGEVRPGRLRAEAELLPGRVDARVTARGERERQQRETAQQGEPEQDAREQEVAVGGGRDDRRRGAW